MAHENAPGRTETLRMGHVRVGSREKESARDALSEGALQRLIEDV